MKQCTFFHSRKFFKYAVITLFIFSLLNVNVLAQHLAKRGHSHPRAAVFHFGGRQPEWYAQFDMVITPFTHDGFALSVHAINPDCIVLASRDWNVDEVMDIPEEWLLRDSQGNPVRAYGGASNLIDITNYCSGSSAYGGKKYNEYLPIFMSTIVDFTIYDGICSQGVWNHPYNTDDVDIDGNGVNDWDEHGKSWLIDVWTQGVEKAVEELRNLLGDDKIIHLNSGNFHTFAWYHSNGMMKEHCSRTFNVIWELNKFYRWEAAAPYPHTFFFDACGPTKNDFYQMRYFLGKALTYNAYSSYTDWAAGEHHYTKYYDEYELNLGFPTDSVKQITSSEISEQGIWVKFFENGAVIVNFDNYDNTITDAQLQTLQYYEGPYYRFLGGQDPDFNNGERFTEVTLTGRTRVADPLGFVGDAIILLKEPDTVLADIIVDNIDAGTSPSSNAATFKGTWTHSADNNYAFWGVGGRAYCDLFNYAKIQPGRGEAYAEYIPTIGVPGNYEVFEWHGFLGSNEGSITEASNVPVIIKFSDNQVAEGFIDQSRDYKQWNSLGTYYFTKGTSGGVKITNEANGQVMADAFKFVYKGEDADDTVSPNPPENLQMVDNSEHTITLTWNAPGAASDGDSAAAYQVFRNGHLVGRPFINTFTDEDLYENTNYTYEVYSIDNVGNRSSTNIQAVFKTDTDQIPPEILDARLINDTKLEVIFSENVDNVSAETPSNYDIDNGIIVNSATMSIEDSSVYYLNTSEHMVGVQYTLSGHDIMDRASTPNSIDPNKTVGYVGITGDSLRITITADNVYKLYVNGYYIAEADGWSDAETYEIPTIGGTNLIAIQATDRGGEAAILAEIEFGNELFVTNENWKITTSEEAGWETLSFEDALWESATSYGLHGSAEPWAKYTDVEGISTSYPVHWIWSSDFINDDVVFFRFTLDYEGDNTAPQPPADVSVSSSYQ